MRTCLPLNSCVARTIVIYTIWTFRRRAIFWHAIPFAVRFLNINLKWYHFETKYYMKYFQNAAHHSMSVQIWDTDPPRSTNYHVHVSCNIQNYAHMCTYIQTYLCINSKILLHNILYNTQIYSLCWGIWKHCLYGIYHLSFTVSRVTWVIYHRIRFNCDLTTKQRRLNYTKTYFIHMYHKYDAFYMDDATMKLYMYNII